MKTTAAALTVTTKLGFDAAIERCRDHPELAVIADEVGEALDRVVRSLES